MLEVDPADLTIEDGRHGQGAPRRTSVSDVASAATWRPAAKPFRHRYLRRRSRHPRPRPEIDRDPHAALRTGPRSSDQADDGRAVMVCASSGHDIGRDQPDDGRPDPGRHDDSLGLALLEASYPYYEPEHRGRTSRLHGAEHGRHAGIDFPMIENSAEGSLAQGVRGMATTVRPVGLRGDPPRARRLAHGLPPAPERCVRSG
jgi:hypothetical protein